MIHKFLISVAVSTTLLIPLAAVAEQVQLTCTRETGWAAGKVIIDAEAGTFQHGDITMSIIGNDDFYLTAINDHLPSPGGTVWVIEKSTGRFTMSATGLSCTDEGCTDQKIRAFTGTGLCV